MAEISLHSARFDGCLSQAPILAYRLLLRTVEDAGVLRLGSCRIAGLAPERATPPFARCARSLLGRLFLDQRNPSCDRPAPKRPTDGVGIVASWCDRVAHPSVGTICLRSFLSPAVNRRSRGASTPTAMSPFSSGAAPKARTTRPRADCKRVSRPRARHPLFSPLPRVQLLQGRPEST